MRFFSQTLGLQRGYWPRQDRSVAARVREGETAETIERCHRDTHVSCFYAGPRLDKKHSGE